MLHTIRTLFLSSIVAFLINTQQIFACPQVVLEDASNNNTSSQYIISGNLPPELDLQIVSYLTDPQDLKAFSEVSQAHRNYIEDYVDKYIENCIHNRKSKYKQKESAQTVDTKKFLRSLSVACPLDHWWMKLEIKLLVYPLDKIQSNEEAFNYINPSIRYLKSYEKTFYGKLDRNNHIPLSIYHRALSIFSSFKEDNELKYQCGRLLFHGRYLRSNSLNKIDLKKSRAIFKNFSSSSGTLGARAKYFLFKYHDFNENRNSIKRTLEQLTFTSTKTKIIKLRFNMAQSFEGGTITYDNGIQILKNPPEKLMNEYLSELRECRLSAGYKVSYMLLELVNLFEASQDTSYENYEYFFGLFKYDLRSERVRKEQKLNEANLNKLYNLFKKITIIEALMLNEKKLDKQAINMLSTLAENNDVFSHYLLGRIYSFKGEEFAEKSFKYFKEASEQGFNSAYASVGIMYLRGDGVERDYQHAFKWLKKSADCNIGLAQFLLAEMYRKGQGTEPNYRLAVKYYQYAGNKTFYEDRYLYKGRKLFFLNGSNYYLGWMHERGIGVERDLDKAKLYYKKIPARQSWLRLDLGIDDGPIDEYEDPFTFFCMGYLSQSNKNDISKAIEYYKEAVKRSDHSLSQIAIGKIYKESKNLDSDVAKILFQDVANKNEGIGYYNLALMHRDGEGVEQDDKKAFELFSSAASTMYGDALYSLGWMYEQGRGVEKDLEKAEYYYNEGKKRYPADAFYSLGRMYEYGLSVLKNIQEANKWYEAAAALYYPEAIIKFKTKNEIISTI
jgi:TPR repeat protein